MKTLKTLVGIGIALFSLGISLIVEKILNSRSNNKLLIGIADFLHNKIAKKTCDIAVSIRNS